MPSFLELGYLIPLTPTIGAIFVWILLVSFNRTTNRLTKPISFLLIASVGISTVISFLFFHQELFGQILDLDLASINLSLHLRLSIDKVASIFSIVFGLIVLTVMFSSYFLLDRKKGYVRYFILLGFISGSVFTFILSGDLFHKYF